MPSRKIGFIDLIESDKKFHVMLRRGDVFSAHRQALLTTLFALYHLHKKYANMIALDSLMFYHLNQETVKCRLLFVKNMQRGDINKGDKFRKYLTNI